MFCSSSVPRCSRRPPAGSGGPRIRSAALATLLLLGAAPLQSQERERISVSGTIVDAADGQPLANVSVRLAHLNIGTLTDRNGRFDLHRIAPGEHDLEVHLLGYRRLVHRLTLEDGMQPLRLQMHVDPILMEGVIITTDRLESRRRGSGWSSRVIDAERLRFAATGDLTHAVAQVAGLRITECTGRYIGMSCIVVRGQPMLPTVYIDEARVHYLDMINLYHPDEIHAVEVFGGGRHVRVYTTRYIERLARSGQRLQPIFF